MNYLMKAVVLVFFISPHICNDQVNNIILQKYINEGIENNLAMKNENLSIKQEIEKLNQIKSLFYPNIALNSSYSLAHGGRSIDIPTGDLMNPVYSILNQLVQGANFPSISNTSEPFLASNYQDSRFSFVLNVLNTDIYYNYRAQKKYISVMKAKKEVFENELKKNISIAYYSYLQTLENINILYLNRNTLEQVKKYNESLLKNGISTKEIIYDSNYEISLLDLQISEAQKNITVAKKYFNSLLNKELTSDIEIDSTIFSDECIKNLLVLKSSYVNNKKSEVEEIENLIDLKKITVSRYKKNMFVPKITSANNTGFQGYKFKFNTDQFYTYAQINFQWSLFSGGEKRAKLRAAKLDLQIAQNKYQDILKQLEFEEDKCYEELIVALKKYENAKVALLQSQEAFKISFNKYQHGQVLWVDFIKRQNNYLASQIQLSVMKYDVMMKYINYQKSKENL